MRWIASSQGLLAMTLRGFFDTNFKSRRASAFPRRHAPEVLPVSSLRSIRGRRDARRRCARSSRFCASCAPRSHRKTPGIPARCLYGLLRDLPAMTVPPSPSGMTAGLTTSFKDIRTARLARPLRHARLAYLRATASAPTLMTLAKSPGGTGRQSILTDLSFLKIRIFFAEGLDDFWVLRPSC